MNFEKLPKEIILEKILAPASRKSLLNFINWLDMECINSQDPSSLPFQILARSIIAVGYKLLDNEGAIETIVQTIRSGENYALNPTENTWETFHYCSTNSYPFGPGDGCYSIEELEGVPHKHSTPGSGCTSGAGSLASLGMNEAEVMKIIAKELAPWISEIDDPIISRPQSV